MLNPRVCSKLCECGSHEILAWNGYQNHTKHALLSLAQCFMTFLVRLSCDSASADMPCRCHEILPWLSEWSSALKTLFANLVYSRL